MKTPDLSPKPMTLEVAYANKLLGLQLSEKELESLLEKMRFGIGSGKKKKGSVTVLVPSYRTDILHPMDLVEDIAIAYGYKNFVPEMPKISTVGKKSTEEQFNCAVRELLLGSGFQEVMTLIMTSKNNLFGRMRLPEQGVVETENPVSVEHSVGRTWLTPSLMNVLERNKNREYPQRVFEIGDCLTGDGKEERKVAAVIAHSKANYSETKAIASGFLASIGVELKAKPLAHQSFLEGRCASIGFGFYGEIHPEVLENFGLEVPVCAFEFDLGTIQKSLSL